MEICPTFGTEAEGTPLEKDNLHERGDAEGDVDEDERGTHCEPVVLTLVHALGRGCSGL